MSCSEIRMIDDMQMRNLSPHTQSAYRRAVLKCCAHGAVAPEQLTTEHVRDYLLHLVQKRGASWSLYNQTR
jgi:integrase/recombinase XerD